MLYSNYRLHGQHVSKNQVSVFGIACNYLTSQKYAHIIDFQLELQYFLENFSFIKKSR